MEKRKNGQMDRQARADRRTVCVAHGQIDANGQLNGWTDRPFKQRDRPMDGLFKALSSFCNTKELWKKALLID